MSDAEERPFDEIASSHNVKFRNGYSRMVTLLVGLVLLMLVLTPLFLLVTFMPNQPRYYASTTSGQVYSMFSLSEPVVTDTYLRQWVGTIAGGMFTVSFNDWKKELEKYKIDFTPTAWQDLMNTYNQGGFAKNLEQNQLVSSAVIANTPKILDRNVIHGRYTWSVLVPVLIKYSNAAGGRQQKVSLSLVVSRVPVLNAPQGIQISSVRAKVVKEQGV